MKDNFQDLMRAATRLTQAGRLKEATLAIQRALSGARVADAVSRQTVAQTDGVPPHSAGPATPVAQALVLEGCAFEVDAAPAAAVPTGHSDATAFATQPEIPHVRPRPIMDAGEARPGPGEFTSGSHTHAALKRRYKLYLPPGPLGLGAGQPALVVMLHGCTQDPDDFAAGTGMNERAREQGFYVLYPEQSREANPQRCWNWFKHNHQQRGSGEPALIASLTQAVMKAHGIDARRVYIAGLSAGGAMAAIVASAYPDIFAAAGVHSGLPGGAASDVAGALAVMRSGAKGPGPHAGKRVGTAPAKATLASKPVPTIVFHGDLDQTVHPRNGEQVIAAALEAAAASSPGAAGGPRVEQGVSAQGRRYTRSTHHGGKGHALAEHWLVHGAGHAWSGGHADGSFTDARGPDATREMLRFFFEHPRAPGH